jgi:RNA polymerase sigma-70 factor (ECF subfamily)
MRTVSLKTGKRIAREAGGFGDFFEAQHARLYGTLCLVTADAAEAEDVMQEAFLKVWERWDRVAEHPDPPGYLYRTAFNLYRSRIRRAVRAARRALSSPEPADPIAGVDDREALLAALKTLPRRQRAAVVMLDLLDFSSEEAGRLLGIRPVTARVLASQARASLRETEGEIDD